LPAEHDLILGTPDGSCRLGITQKQLDELYIVCTAKEEDGFRTPKPRPMAGAFFLCGWQKPQTFFQ